MPFEDILGQKRAVDRVRGFLTSSRLPHAVALAGPRGAGKKLLALALAKSAYCKTRKDDFCDTCVQCKRINHNNHPDVYLLSLTNKEPSYKIATLREAFISRVYVASVEGGPKFFIIDDAHKMTPAGQNAILKTLEEPPESTQILLLVEELHALLPTVRSRLQTVYLRPLADEELSNIAKKAHPEVSGPDMAFALRFARGSAARALEILDKGGAFLEVKRAVVSALAQVKPKRVLKAIDELTGVVGSAALTADVGGRHARRAKAAGVTELILLALRDAAVLAAAGEDSLIINADQMTQIRSIADKLGLETVLRLTRLVQRARQALGVNVNVDVMLKRIMLEFAAAAPVAI